MKKFIFFFSFFATFSQNKKKKFYTLYSILSIYWSWNIPNLRFSLLISFTLHTIWTLTMTYLYLWKRIFYTNAFKEYFFYEFILERKNFFLFLWKKKNFLYYLWKWETYFSYILYVSQNHILYAKFTLIHSLTLKFNYQIMI